ncbi:MAG: ribonuclease HIII, partial [Armatimonadota bacterium]
SKRVTDAQCLRLSGKIRATCPHKIVQIPPRKYNELHLKMRNLNRLLAWAHARAIEDLLERNPKILEEPGTLRLISDQFAKPETVGERLFELGKKLQLESRVRAESELCVAAASLIARATFLSNLKHLSEQWAMVLPKGAGPEVIRAGRVFVSKHGKELLCEVAKVHFRTTESVLQSG